jgi:hypothetical protein
MIDEEKTISEPNKKNKSKFKVLQITKINDITQKTELPESDLTIQSDDTIFQFEYYDPDKDKAIVTIKSGSYNFEDTNTGIRLKKLNLQHCDLLKSIANTTLVLEEGNKFFSRLDIYKKLNREPKRALLLSSKPGCGKTAAIIEVCHKFLEKNGTAVIIWDTSDIKCGRINRFFLNYSKFHKDVKRLILVMEDISGGSIDKHDYETEKGTASALLNLLDGTGIPFKGMPTFIIATTNNPETTVEALIDRPGRFDKVIELNPPTEDECKALYKFILKTDRLDSSTIEAAKKAAAEKFSIAHIQETIVRSMLDDITILDATEELIKHKKRFKEAFLKIRSNHKGIGFGASS